MNQRFPVKLMPLSFFVVVVKKRGGGGGGGRTIYEQGLLYNVYLYKILRTSSVPLAVFVVGRAIVYAYTTIHSID